MEGILDTYYYALKSCILFTNSESFSNKILFERTIFFILSGGIKFQIMQSIEMNLHEKNECQ